MNTTRVVAALERRAVAGAVDRDRVEHVAARASAARAAGTTSRRDRRSRSTRRCRTCVRRKRSIRPEKYQQRLPSRFVSRSLTVLIPDGSAAKLPRSSRERAARAAASPSAACGRARPRSPGDGAIAVRRRVGAAVTVTRTRFERTKPASSALRSLDARLAATGRRSPCRRRRVVAADPTFAPRDRGVPSAASVTFNVTVSPVLAGRRPAQRPATLSPNAREREQHAIAVRDGRSSHEPTSGATPFLYSARYFRRRRTDVLAGDRVERRAAEPVVPRPGDRDRRGGDHLRRWSPRRRTRAGRRPCS